MAFENCRALCDLSRLKREGEGYGDMSTIRVFPEFLTVVLVVPHRAC